LCLVWSAGLWVSVCVWLVGGWRVGVWGCCGVGWGWVLGGGWGLGVWVGSGGVGVGIGGECVVLGGSEVGVWGGVEVRGMGRRILL